VKNVKPLVDSDQAAAAPTAATGAVALVNRAPHPNAAKVYINWLLSKQGETVYSKDTGYNSRRTDVAPVDPELAIDPKRQYIETNTEDQFGKRDKALEIAKQTLK
jgi:ABC-type Fe3+ transport system substrate-binding protein